MAAADERGEMLYGALDMLILKALQLEPMHGQAADGVSRRRRAVVSEGRVHRPIGIEAFEQSRVGDVAADQNSPIRLEQDRGDRIVYRPKRRKDAGGAGNEESTHETDHFVADALVGQSGFTGTQYHRAGLERQSLRRFDREGVLAFRQCGACRA